MSLEAERFGDEHRLVCALTTSAPATEIEPGLARLANDIDSGAWDTRFARLREQEQLDVGYRLLVAKLKTQ